MDMNNVILEEATERIFVLPALMIIENNESISTTTLITNLMDLFNPEGHDSKILSGRNDTYFSQKVRNLAAHKTIDSLTYYSRNNWRINEDGEKFLQKNKDIVEEVKVIICDSTFSYFEKITFINEIMKYLSIKGESNSEKGKGKKIVKFPSLTKMKEYLKARSK